MSRNSSPLPLAGEGPGERAPVGAAAGRDQSFRTSWISRFLQFFLLAIIAITAQAADLTASVDRNQISIEETFTLRLRYSGQETGGQPDFELLEQDFEILSRQQSNQYRVYNGQAESFVEWVLTLAPKKEGKLFVPSLHYASSISDAIPITVSQAAESPADASRQAFLEVELDKNQLHVQEQLLVKVRLYTTIGLHDIATEPLEIPGAHVEKVDEQRYERRINNVPHAVYELTYAVFPESSGKLEIPALNYVAVAGRRDPFSLFNRNSQRLRLRSQPKTVTVLPKPDSYSGEHWLPAASLGLVQSWSQDPETFKVGEPITRIITLRAEGLRAAQLPPLPRLEVDGLKTYPDQPQQDDQVGLNGVVGNRIETTAIVATKPGDYQLPPITITWWDTKTGQQRATQLPAFRFTIAGAATADTQAPAVEAKPDVAPSASEPYYWKAIAIAALASHLLWLLYFYRQRRQRSRQVTTSRTTTENTQQLEQALVNATNNGDVEQIQQALRHWLKARWPEAKGNTLVDINQELKFEELGKLQEILDAALYLIPPKPLNRQQVQILVSRLVKQERTREEFQEQPLPGLFS